ncbi:MAG: L,D-transpeptidase family protein [Mangrovibacterium sp.]
MSAGIAGLLIGSGLLVGLSPKPPLEALRNAREAIASAEKAGAGNYAVALFLEAGQLYDSAMICWAGENRRFAPFRDFSGTEYFAGQVAEKARIAEQQAICLSSGTHCRIRKGIAELEEKVALYHRRYRTVPLPAPVIRIHNRGRMKLSEASLALEDRRYQEAGRHYDQARVWIERANDQSEGILRSWFEQYPQWEKHAKQAVCMSKGCRVIMIDKYAHACLVYHDGKLIRRFDAEFGPNWMSQKYRKGDKATPEGIYRVSQKKEGGRTLFHKALLINYPNEEDKRRFAESQKKSSASTRANIGGLIELHGMGGKGVDWTDGCVALRNADMDVLYQLIPAGTPVVIVGSLKTLEELP